MNAGFKRQQACGPIFRTLDHKRASACKRAPYQRIAPIATMANPARMWVGVAERWLLLRAAARTVVLLLLLVLVGQHLMSLLFRREVMVVHTSM